MVELLNMKMCVNLLFVVVGFGSVAAQESKEAGTEAKAGNSLSKQPSTLQPTATEAESKKVLELFQLRDPVDPTRVLPPLPKMPSPVSSEKKPTSASGTKTVNGRLVISKSNKSQREMRWIEGKWVIGLKP